MKKRTEIEEPTLGEVLAVMNERFTHAESSMNQRFNILNERVDNIDTHLNDMSRIQSTLVNQVADIQDDLASALRALDTDALTVLNHEQRISRLEKSHT